MKRYAKSKYPHNVVVKYIVVEHINDTVEEVTKFVNLMADIGVQNIEFMIDNKYSLFTDLDTTPLPLHYKDLYLCFKQKCEERGIKLMMWSKTEHIVNNYLFYFANLFR